MKNIANMPPEQIRAALALKKITQKDIAVSLGVTGALVSNVIEGRAVSHKVRVAIAEAINLKVELIWPKTYLYGIPQKRGRRKSQGIKMNSVQWSSK